MAAFGVSAGDQVDAQRPSTFPPALSDLRLRPRRFTVIDVNTVALRFTFQEVGARGQDTITKTTSNLKEVGRQLRLRDSPGSSSSTFIDPPTGEPDNPGVRLEGTREELERDRRRTYVVASHRSPSSNDTTTHRTSPDGPARS